MIRMSYRIGWMLLLGFLLAMPSVVCGQAFDASTLMRAQQNGHGSNLYGNNPFEQPDEEGDGEQQDTTKKERKIRKPLESYFFDDSTRSLNHFRWHVERGFNRVQVMPLDTTLTDYRID